MRLQKLYKVFVRDASEKDPPDASTQADAFAELVQCLDDRSLSLVIRDARDDGRKALEVLRQHYQGKGKPRIISLYTELTSLKELRSFRQRVVSPTVSSPTSRVDSPTLVHVLMSVRQRRVVHMRHGYTNLSMFVENNQNRFNHM